MIFREYAEPPSIDDVTNLPSTTAILPDDQSTTPIISSDGQSQNDIKSIGRDFAPMFYILAIIFALILLGFISTIYNHRGALFRRSQRRNTNSVYSQLTSANEFNLD